MTEKAVPSTSPEADVEISTMEDLNAHCFQSGICCSDPFFADCMLSSLLKFSHNPYIRLLYFLNDILTLFKEDHLLSLDTGSIPVAQQSS